MSAQHFASSRRLDAGLPTRSSNSSYTARPVQARSPAASRRRFAKSRGSSAKILWGAQRRRTPSRTRLQTTPSKAKRNNRYLKPCDEAALGLDDRDQQSPEFETPEASSEVAAAEPRSDDLAEASMDPATIATVGFSGEILDSLPVGLLVHLGDDLLHANPEFLRLTGYDTLDDFKQEGGIDALFANDEEVGDTEPDGTMTLIRKTGQLRSGNGPPALDPLGRQERADAGPGIDRSRAAPRERSEPDRNQLRLPSPTNRSASSRPKSTSCARSSRRRPMVSSFSDTTAISARSTARRARSSTTMRAKSAASRLQRSLPMRARRRSSIICRACPAMGLPAYSTTAAK